MVVVDTFVFLFLSKLFFKIGFSVFVEKDRLHDCKTPFAIGFVVGLRQKQKNITMFFCILSFVVEMNSPKTHFAYLFFCILQFTD